jgi:hypothetical protein
MAALGYLHAQPPSGARPDLTRAKHAGGCPARAHIGHSPVQFLTIARALAVVNSVLIGGTLCLAVQAGTDTVPSVGVG